MMVQELYHLTKFKNTKNQSEENIIEKENPNIVKLMENKLDKVTSCSTNITDDEISEETKKIKLYLKFNLFNPTYLMFFLSLTHVLIKNL